MKLLLDQNLPSRILRGVGTSFPGSAHVKDMGLAQASDLEVWELSASFEPIQTFLEDKENGLLELW